MDLWANIVVRFWSASGSWHMSCLIKTSPRHTTRCASRISPRSIIPPFPRSLLILKTQLSRDHSSFIEHHHPEVDPSRPGKIDAATDLVDHCLYWWRSWHRQIIPFFKRAITSIPMQTVAENSRNLSFNQEHNSGCHEEISTCKSCGYGNSYNSHHQ